MTSALSPLSSVHSLLCTFPPASFPLGSLSLSIPISVFLNHQSMGLHQSAATFMWWHQTLAQSILPVRGTVPLEKHCPTAQNLFLVLSQSLCEALMPVKRVTFHFLVESAATISFLEVNIPCHPRTKYNTTGYILQLEKMKVPLRSIGIQRMISCEHTLQSATQQERMILSKRVAFHNWLNLCCSKQTPDRTCTMPQCWSILIEESIISLSQLRSRQVRLQEGSAL